MALGTLRTAEITLELPPTVAEDLEWTCERLKVASSQDARVYVFRFSRWRPSVL